MNVFIDNAVRRSRNHQPEINLKSIHKTIVCVTQHEKAYEIRKNSPCNENVVRDNSRDIVMTFEDALQAIEISPRPCTVEDVKKISEVLVLAATLADRDGQKWKFLILTIIRKRFHMKSPEAKHIKSVNQDAAETDLCTSGHGERLTTYIFFHLPLLPLHNSTRM